MFVNMAQATVALYVTAALHVTAALWQLPTFDTRVIEADLGKKMQHHGSGYLQWQ